MAAVDPALTTLLRAIAARDGATIDQLLTDDPSLATAALRGGATRQTAQENFLTAIAHYMMAGDTALHIAAAAGQPPLVERLLAMGADVEASNRRAQRPLHYAVDGGPRAGHRTPDQQRRVVELLVAGGADPNAADKSGTRPLHRAVRNRCTAAVAALLEGGADPALDNGRGSTAASLAQVTSGKSGSGTPDAKAAQAEIIRLLDRAAT